MRSEIIYLLALAGSTLSIPTNIELRSDLPVWETLPPTPALPSPINTTLSTIDGVPYWYQVYGKDNPGVPIVMLHGGLGYSAYFGDVIRELAKKYYVIARDTRGHGRSTFEQFEAFNFRQFAQDTAQILKAEGIGASIWVGWSDGATTGFAALMDPEINKLITQAFLFAGSQSPADTNATFSQTAIYSDFVTRCQKEYAVLQPKSNFTAFGEKVANMENTLPNYSVAELAKIDGSKVQIVKAEYDEAVNLATPNHLHAVIKGSSFKELTNVSHFAPVQDPKQFTAAIEAFIKP